MAILRRVAAKECRKPGCPGPGRPASVHDGFCERCGQPLQEVLGWDLRRIALSIGGPMVLLLPGFALVSYLAHRPHPLTDDSRQRLAAWVRQADHDRSDQAVTPRRQAELDELVARERLDPQATARFVAATHRRLEDARLEVERGLRFAAAGRYAEALREYQRAVENDPENATAWADLGLANAATGREQAALDGYAKALQVDPGNWLAHYNLGMLCARRGDAAQALQHLERAFAARPDPASPEHRSMAADLRTAAVPDPLRRDPRFAALLAAPERPSR